MKRYVQILPLLLLGWLCAIQFATAQAPIADYSFSGNAKDGAPGKNHASVHGAYLSTDRFGIANHAFSFDGSQSYLEAAQSNALNTDYATLSFWVRVNALLLIGEVYLIFYGGWQERFKVSLPNHGKLVWTTNSTGGIKDLDSGSEVLAPGEWKHVVFVHDGAKDIIYIDGVLANEKDSPGELNGSTHNLGIGYNVIDGGNFFDGDLDDVQIYGEALDASEVANLFAAQSANPTFAPALVASYSFGSDLTDASGYGNNLSAKNVSSTTDRFGYGDRASDMNGSDSEMKAGSSAQLNSPYATVSFWVKANTLPASGEVFLLSYGGWQERFKISLPSHGKAVWTTNSSAGISDMDAGGGNELVPGKWTHVVASHDGTTDKIYINGALAASKAVGGTLNSTNEDLGIGYNAIDGGNWFDGSFDELQMYNYALTDAQVTALYTDQSTFTGSSDPLIAAYSFSGNTEDDTQFKNNAKNGGATLTNDRFGYANNAIHFAGADSLLVDNSTQLNTPTTTISFWAKVDELPASGEVFLMSHGGWQERWKISLPAHGKVVFTTNHTNGISDMDAGGGNELVVGQWRHIVMTHDGAKDIIYMNGVQVAQKDVVGTLNSTKYPLGIGNNPIDAGNYFKGSLDEIQIYNTALTAANVADLYAEQNQSPNFPAGIVANYTFDGDSDDHTPYFNNAVVHGAQLTSDRFDRANKAFAFDGISDEITASNSPQQNSNHNTVSFWINVKNLPATGEAFILSNGGWQERWKISLPSHGKPVWTTNNVGGISDMDSGVPLVPGSWTHVVMTHDGANDKIFFNGVKQAEKAVTGNMNSTTHPLGMGYNPVDGGNWFDGSLDEVQLYNIALTDAEVAALYIEQSTAPVETDIEAPDAPLNLSASVNFTTVTLSWWPSTDNVAVVGYNVYMNGNKVGTTSETSLTLSSLQALTEFTFAVSAVDEAGNESEWSTLKVTTGDEETPDVTPPTAPGNLSGITGSYSVLLTWEASTDDRFLQGYVVFVDGVFVDSLGGGATSVLVGDLEPETPYSFEIYAFDKAGNNSEVSEVTLTTDAEINTGEAGLVAWYPFEGNANDATLYANHGVIGGDPTFVTADHPNGGAQAIKFDGVQDSVLAPNAVQLISDYTTVSFWIKVEGIDPNLSEAYILDFGHWSQRWKISLPQHHRIVWTTNSDNNTSPNFIVDMDAKDGNELVNGFWWYVTMVADGTNNMIYVDGELANSVPALGTLNSTGYPLGMGSNPIDGGQYFNGALDEVKIYNKALIASEIKDLFEKGTTSTKDDLNSGLIGLVTNVYPNPTTDKLILEHSFDVSKSMLIRITDVQGRQIDAVRYAKYEMPQGQFSLDVKAYPVGKYFVNFVLDGKNIGSVKFDKF
ncbi:MAG: LamG-like jellyroll fold domain-containing protein [Saprospiraceae bacterium]